MLFLVGCASESALDRIREPPKVTITAPAEGEGFRQGAGAILAQAVAEDSFDGPEDLEVRWQLGAEHAEGQLEWELDPDALARAEHELAITVVDSDGDVGEDSVRFTVLGPAGAPTVEITAPENGASWIVGEAVTFTGRAEDTVTGADDLSFAWTSDRDGALAGAISGEGQSALPIDTLSEGEHVVTLTAIDTDAEVGSDAISVTVLPPEPEPAEPGDLIFTEIMVNPSVVADEDGEWVEVYNTSGAEIDLAGYSFHDDVDDYWIFDASVYVPAKGYAVLCANPDAATNGGIPCDGWFYRYPMGEKPPAAEGHGPGVAIANNDDSIFLTSPENVDIDVFDYNDTTSDPIEAAMSFGLDPDRLDGVENDDVDNWCVQRTILSGATEPGTPGQKNDQCGDF